MTVTFLRRFEDMAEAKNLSTIYGIVKNEKIKADTEALVSQFEPYLKNGWTKDAKKEYQAYKKTHFPVACFSLNGIDRNKSTKIQPENHTGLINLDLDENTKFELTRFRSHLSEFSFIHFCALSVSGSVTGHLWLNILVEIPKTFEDIPETISADWAKETWLDSLHKLYIFFVSSIFQQRYNVHVGSAKDLKRARYLSYDSAPYSNPKSQPITLSELATFYESIPKEPKTEKTQSSNKTVSDIIRRAALDTLNQFSHPDLDDRENFVDFCMACKWEGLPYEDIDGIFRKNSGYDRAENERIYAGLNPNGSKTFGSIVRKAKEVNADYFQARKKYYRELEKSAPDDIPDGLGLASKIGLTLHSLCQLSYSTLSDKIYINGKPITDPAFSWVYCHMVDRGFKSQEMIRQVMLREANRKRFHPVHKFLNELVWDKQERLTTEVLSVFFKDKDGIFPHLLRKWLIGAVGKVFTGSQNPMLVLVGLQGKGKSYFSKFLCPLDGYYLESHIESDNKDDLIRLAEKVVWEVFELGATTKRQDQESLKAFISRETVMVRRPYDKFDIERQAMASFIGTVNDDGTGFLNDITGNRRYRVAHMTEIVWAYAKELSAPQLWAEAVQAYRDGETIELGKQAAEMMSARMQEHFETKDPLEDYVQECFVLTEDPGDQVKSIDVMAAVYDAGYKGRNARADSMALSKVMNHYNCEKIRIHGQRGYTGLRHKANYERN